MNRARFIVGQIFIFLMLLPGESFAASDRKCTVFRVTFDTSIDAIPADVVLKKSVVGTVNKLEEQALPVREVEICIDPKYSGEFEKNTICYISGGKLLVYNLWSTGADLAEGGHIKGFTSNRGIFIHEVKILLDLMRDAIIGVFKSTSPNAVKA